MARRANNAPKESNPVQEFDQAAIDAALAGAVTRMDGSPVPSMQKGNEPLPPTTDDCAGKPDPDPEKDKASTKNTPIAAE